MMTPWLKTGIQVAQNDRGGSTTNRFRAISSRLARSMADLVSKNGHFGAVFSTIVLKTEDDRQCAEYV